MTPLASGATNLGPESIVDTPADPANLAPGADPSTAGFKPSLLTQVCSRSVAIGQSREGRRVTPVLHRRRSRGRALGHRAARPVRHVSHPTQVVSVNEPCSTPGSAPAAVFQQFYEGVRVQCAQYGQDYSVGQIVPIRGAASDHPAVPADAVTASASGLDPDISPAYAEIQVARVARARGISARHRCATRCDTTSTAGCSASSASRWSTCWHSISSWTASPR